MWPFHQRPTRAAPSEATAARLKAERDLKETQSQTPEIAAFGKAMRELRKRNNFAAAIETSFRGGQSS